MANRISRARLREALKRAEQELRECFDVVMGMVHWAKDTVTGDDIVGFQPKLLRTVVELEDLYRDVKREQTRLIVRKAKYQQAWFKRRMAKLTAYRKSLRAALAIARSIGDGYAWFWYERDAKLIDEHLRHQHQPFLPTGVGGLGEQLTLQRMQGFDRKLLLYHGLTSFLRMGDVTFIDLDTARVAYLAEIKTAKSADNGVTVELSLVMDTARRRPELPVAKADNALQSSLSERMRDKQKRQIKAMGDAVVRAIKDTDRQLGLDGLFHFSELEEAVSKAPVGDFVFVQAGPSMIISAIQSNPKRSLADALLGDGKQIKPKGEGLADWVKKIVLPGAENALNLSSPADPERLQLRTTDLPFTQWPVDREILRTILFQEVIVVTLHNPVHFWNALRQRGFELKADQRGLFTGARKVAGDRIQELENFRGFERLTPDGFVKLETVLAMIDQSLNEMEKVNPSGGVRFEFRPRISRKSGKNDDE